jgi:hypothetical protein
MTEEPKMVKLGSHQLLEQVMYCFCCHPCCFTATTANPASAAAAATPVVKLLDTKDCKDVSPIDWCCTCLDTCNAPCRHIESNDAIAIPTEREANQQYIYKEPIDTQSLP